MPENNRNPPVEMRPHRTLRSLYLTYLLIIIWAGVLPWLIPLSFFFPPVLVLALTVPLLLLVLYLIWWTGAYYHTILYRFSPDGITWERGVWWRKNGMIPYNRIATVDVIQGPLSRFFGISTIRVQTTGYPAGSPSVAELKIEGVPDAGSIREYILDQMQDGR